MSAEKTPKSGYELATQGEAPGGQGPVKDGHQTEKQEPRSTTRPCSMSRQTRLCVLLVLGLISMIVIVVVLTLFAKRDNTDVLEHSTSEAPTTDPPVYLSPHEFVYLSADNTSDIYSPNYPDVYPVNSTFTWLIEAPDGYSLNIHFRLFSLEDKFDFLQIGSGRRPLKPGTMFQTLTGYDKPTDILYPGNRLYFHLVSDPVHAFAGFWIRVTAVKGTDDFTCPKGHSPCQYTRSCFTEEDRCDGALKCQDGTDEAGCDCPDPWDERCGDGMCIVRTQVCDGHVLCLDDELNCTFTCRNGRKIRPDYICDGFNDCIDNTDEEQNCECTSFQYACADGRCIHKNNVCNGMYDCTDGEDEMNCVCESWQFRCPDDSCIPGWLTCNGNPDCPGGNDERDCPVCPGRYYQCKDHRCIATDLLCDGTPNCANNEDEENCESTCGPNEITCLDGTCAVNGTGCVAMTTVAYDQPSVPNLELLNSTMADSNPEEDVLAHILEPVNCGEDGFACRYGPRCIPREWRCDVIKDCHFGEDEEDCDPEEIKDSCADFTSSDRFVCDGRIDCYNGLDETDCPCGARPMLDARIIMGSAVRPGEWPWQVGLHAGDKKKPFCGGTLINRRWVLTAAHCVLGLPDIRISVGLTNWQTGFNDAQHARISQVHVHPYYAGEPTFHNDIGLIKLTESVTIDNFVQPACLPPPDFELQDGAYVTVTGWGSVVERGENPPNLQAARLPKVPLSYCRSRYSLQLLDSAICAGYASGYQSTCFGDSGGPLVSLVNSSWYSIGTVSVGESCGGPYRPDIFSRTSSYVEFIRGIMQYN